MIIFSKALADQATVWEALRESESCQDVPADLLRFSAQTKPVVMWNLTRRCNLACKHCYMDASQKMDDELSLEEGLNLVDDLARMKIPILILTGGEPLMSHNLFPLAFHAQKAGLRTVISTNGTLITPEVAGLLAEAGIRYVGVSLDSVLPARHDDFRGVPGAFDRALQGLRNARDAGLKTGLRITLTKDNWQDVPALLNLAIEENIPRFCLYHLVPTGRGAEISDKDVSSEQRRSVIRLLAEAAVELKDKNIEILTTDSPMDGAYLLELLKDDPRRDYVRRLLTNAGGCSAGAKVANISYKGDVHPCHFMPQVVVGNVRERSFQDIWIDHPTPELLALRTVKSNLKGACGSCDYRELCGGCRQKAFYYNGDLLAEDPTCIVENKCG
jgi:radical SAM protein with 4Fe4S-binding SPASM domain